MANQHLKGTGVALVTPFQKNGSIDYPALDKLVKNVIKGGVDFLVNNASGFGSSDDDKGWGANFTVDMMAIVHATQEALPALKTSRGSVLNISSIAAHHPSARQPPYGAMKAAVIHYTTTQAAMYARDKVRVNCIAPGSIDFPGGV